MVPVDTDGGEQHRLMDVAQVATMNTTSHISEGLTVFNLIDASARAVHNTVQVRCTCIYPTADHEQM